jgi:hypothetical protein
LFRRLLARRFLGWRRHGRVGGGGIQALAYPPEALHDDVRPCLASLAGRYRGDHREPAERVKDASVETADGY